jgi:HD-GYP domain-containing protein (c-di-GMP phosphodiesterase class II)/HAMP domain-containing protein
MARRRYPLHIHIAYLFTILTVLSGAVIGWYNYSKNSSIIVSATGDLFGRIGRETVSEINRLHGPIEMLVDLFAHHRLSEATTLQARMEALPYIQEALKENPFLSALYAGYANGDFFLVRPLANPAVRKGVNAPDGAELLVQSIEHSADGVRHGTYLYLDRTLAVVRRDPRPDYDYDPRTRPWYKEASQTAGQIRTPLYVFFTTREVGTTLARHARTGDAVVGADLTLTALSSALQAQSVTASAELVLFENDGTVLAYTRPERLARLGDDGRSIRLARVWELNVPVLDAMYTRFKGEGARDSLQIDDGERSWMGTIAHLDVKGNQKINLAVLAPNDELLADAVSIRNQSLLITVIILGLTVPFSWFLSRLTSRPLRRLAREVHAIEEFDFSRPIEVEAMISEIDDLARSMDSMKQTIQKFLAIGNALASERDFAALLRRVLDEMIGVLGARGGAVLLRAGNRDSLVLAAGKWLDSQGEASDLALPPQRLDPEAREDDPLATAFATGRTTVRRLAPGDPCLAHDFYQAIRARFGRDGFRLVVLPLRNPEGEIAGATLLVLEEDAGGAAALSPERLAFAEALAGNAAIAIENQRLLRAQKDLLDAFITMLAGAIDAKSSYTGNHCQRVPILTTMLAQAACDATEGTFAGFNLRNDEWEALSVAGWLHDCGKVTTPEYVVDKATKLETIYNRIHEIRTRFEVLKRDAELRYWRAVAEGGDARALRPGLEAEWRTLDEEFAFVAHCNLGGEVMAPERIERLHRIAARRWQRTLDDRLGLAHEELDRLAGIPPRPLPAAEPLLADRPEHVVPLDPQEAAVDTGRLGFRLRTPLRKYHRGELYNLSISRGTLTEEERYKINEHIVQTILMLERLPFPGHLVPVREIAGGHHEKIDGTGYPRGLKGGQMSLAARMVALADVFEALTALDRPYRKAKTLSEAIAILHRMTREGHIDPDLFELFLSAGVHEHFARIFLHEDQIDEVDISRYLSRQSLAAAV